MHRRRPPAGGVKARAVPTFVAPRPAPRGGGMARAAERSGSARASLGTVWTDLHGPKSSVARRCPRPAEPAASPRGRRAPPADVTASRDGPRRGPPHQGARATASRRSDRGVAERDPSVVTDAPRRAGRDPNGPQVAAMAREVARSVREVRRVANRPRLGAERKRSLRRARAGARAAVARARARRQRPLLRGLRRTWVRGAALLSRRGRRLQDLPRPATREALAPHAERRGRCERPSTRRGTSW